VPQAHAPPERSRCPHVERAAAGALNNTPAAGDEVNVTSLTPNGRSRPAPDKWDQEALEELGSYDAKEP
jgi:hypothetical protein